MVSLPPRRRGLIPYAALLAGLIVTVGAARYAHVTAALEDQLRFENDADGVLAAIESRLDAYIAMLLGGAGLFAASDDVTREEFRAYVLRLDVQQHYPGIQGIGFARWIRSGERDALLAALRKDVPSFQFWPGRADDFTAIVYLEPQDERNRLALGFDMTSEVNRAAAMERARDTGAPTATGKVRLVQEGPNAVNPQAGFLIYVPVYREGSVPTSIEQRRRSLLGFVYSPFRAADFLQSIILLGAPAAVAFEVYDDAGRTAQSLMHRTRTEVAAARFELIRTLDFAGRSWTIRFSADDSMRASANRTVVILIGVGGITLSVLLFAVMRGQVRARHAAERTSEELRRSEQRLRVADRAKDEFLATVSHELRTPLNAIIGWASMLGRGALPREMHPHAINVIARNASAQARLVEDLLDMSRVVGGHLRLHLTEVDLTSTLAAAVDALRPAAAEAGLTLLYEPATLLGTVEADSGRLQQIVGNLLSNAIKFTPRGGRIVLHAERVGEMAVITVTDTGIGMEPEFVPFVFERFRQADSSTTRAHSGAGLGLAIARHLVELHGGSIEAASDGPGRGSTFTVRLPARQRRVVRERDTAELLQSKNL